MLTRIVALVLCALLAGLPAQAQTFRQKSSMQTEINGNFADNTAGAITPAIARATYSDMLASWQQAPVVNARPGTNYTLTLGDFGSLITFNSASTVTFAIASGSTAGYYPFSFYVQNSGAGSVVVTPAAGMIGGASTYSVALNGSVLIVSDGTNWQVIGPAGTTGSGCTVSGVGTGYVFNNGSSGCGTSTTLTTSGGIDTESGTLDITGTFKVGGFTMTFPGAAGTIATLNIKDQTVTGGANVNPATNGNLGTLSSGTTTLDCGLVPLQYFTNNGAFTLAAPASDGSCMYLITNGASAGTITLTGFTVGSDTGDAFDTTNAHKFMFSVTRINGTATYLNKTLQ